MFRLLVVPVIIGILAFSLTYFVMPLLFSEADVVSAFAEFALMLSNSVFPTMPSLVADYIARLNLLAVAITVALLVTMAIQILLIIGDAFMLVVKTAISLFKRKPKPAAPRVLSSIDYEGGSANSRPGSRILGGGFDSLDRD